MRYVFDSFVIDAAAREFVASGNTVRVEPKVLDLLLHLIERRDRVVSKDELVEAVWQGRFISDAAISSAVSAARRALRDDGREQRYLRTVHGRGFRFVGSLVEVEPLTSGHAVKEGLGSLHQEIRFCVAADGARIAYATVGEGPPLVKPANWMTHLEHDWHSPVWRHWIRELSRGRRLIRYDERGNGLSDWNVDDLSFEACLRDLEAVVDAAGLDRFPMLGVSQGCASSVAYAVRHPERVSHLVLFGGYARGWGMRGSPDEVARRNALATLIRHGWGEDNPAFRQAFTTMFVPDATPEQMRWFNELQRVTASPENAARLHGMFGSIQIEALLPRVRVPTLVLHSRNEGVVPFEEGRLLATAIPGARFVPLESHNHILLEGEPAWERFLAEVRAFLGPEHP